MRHFADGEAAASALVDGEVMGVFSVDEDGEPVLSLAPGLQIGQTTDMDAIDRSILESVVGTYVRDADIHRPREPRGLRRSGPSGGDVLERRCD